MKNNLVIIEGINDRLPILTTINCTLNSGKSKKRRAILFGEVTKDGKVIRDEEYMLIQNEPKTTYAPIPKQ